VALHGLLKTPEDLLLWDVGHQAYVHKVLTGRADAFTSNRQPGGPSGFPRRSESPFDAWGVGHSSTALSAAVGFARADVALGRSRHRVAVVGDGAMTGGMVFEALNDGGGWGADVLLVINDNGMAIEENVGALHRGGPDAYRGLVESLGWTWVDGRVDGHDLPAVVGALERALALCRRQKRGAGEAMAVLAALARARYLWHRSRSEEASHRLLELEGAEVGMWRW
jgi:1-deoxy-D-xylulose-5-phosphate synthase